MMSEKIDNRSEKGYLKLCEVTPNEFVHACVYCQLCRSLKMIAVRQEFY